MLRMCKKTASYCRGRTCGLPSPLVTKVHAFLNSNCGGLERFSLWRYWGKNDARVLLWTRSVYCLTHAGMVRYHLSD